MNIVRITVSVTVIRKGLENPDMCLFMIRQVTVMLADFFDWCVCFWRNSRRGLWNENTTV